MLKVLTNYEYCDSIACDSVITVIVCTLRGVSNREGNNQIIKRLFEGSTLLPEPNDLKLTLLLGSRGSRLLPLIAAVYIYILRPKNPFSWDGVKGCVQTDYGLAH